MRLNGWRLGYAAHELLHGRQESRRGHVTAKNGHPPSPRFAATRAACARWPRWIGVTGNSRGGTQASLVRLADPRVAAAAPATFIMNRETYQRTGQPQDAEQIWPGFTGAGFDHEDILLAMAPKPVCVLAVTSDFFPIEGTHRDALAPHLGTVGPRRSARIGRG
jgi:hypothetical protein